MTGPWLEVDGWFRTRCFGRQNLRFSQLIQSQDTGIAQSHCSAAIFPGAEPIMREQLLRYHRRLPPSRWPRRINDVFLGENLGRAGIVSCLRARDPEG